MHEYRRTIAALAGESEGDGVIASGLHRPTHVDGYTLPVLQAPSREVRPVYI